MEPTVIVFFVVLLALIFFGVMFIMRKKPDVSSADAYTSYAEGLNLLLAGEDEAALKKFRETVSKDTKNVDAYLKIGDILRTLGQTERAISVHKHLTVRKGLSRKQEIEVLQSLVEDYREADQFDNALAVLNKILDKDKSSAWAKEKKLKLYEAMGDWANAYQTYKKIDARNGKLEKTRLAIYKVKEGMRLVHEKQDEKEAQACFREAIKIDHEGPAAYIALADSFQRQDRKNDALKTLKEFVEKVPKHSFFAFSRIKELLYEGGVYGEIENVYHDIIHSQPDNLMARLALAENYEKKGELEKAVEECKTVLEKEPGNKPARKNLIRLYHKMGDNDRALQIALQLIDESLSKREVFSFEISDFLEESHEA